MRRSVDAPIEKRCHAAEADGGASLSVLEACFLYDSPCERLKNTNIGKNSICTLPGRFELYQLIYVLTATISLLLSAIQLLMLIRAIMSWFPIDEDSVFLRFVFLATEPVIMPVRLFMNRLGLFEGMPIDMSFFITFMLLSILLAFI